MSFFFVLLLKFLKYRKKNYYKIKWNGKNVPPLEITEVVLVNCNIINMIQESCIPLFPITQPAHNVLRTSLYGPILVGTSRIIIEPK